MGYAIDADRIFQQRQVESACNFDQVNFRHTSQNICDLLNKRKIIARRIVNNGLSEGPEYEILIAEFCKCETEIKKLLGL